MGSFDDIFRNYFDAYKTTSKYRDQSKMEIIFRRQEFEKILDDMWGNYSKGMAAQIIEYNKQVASIKDCGLKVLRNSAGKHKIVVPK